MCNAWYPCGGDEEGYAVERTIVDAFSGQDNESVGTAAFVEITTVRSHGEVSYGGDCARGGSYRAPVEHTTATVLYNA